MLIPCVVWVSFGKPNYVLATEGLPENVETWDTSQVVKWAKNLGNGNRAHVLAARYTPSSSSSPALLADVDGRLKYALVRLLTRLDLIRIWLLGRHDSLGLPKDRCSVRFPCPR